MFVACCSILQELLGRTPELTEHVCCLLQCLARVAGENSRVNWTCLLLAAVHTHMFLCSCLAYLNFCVWRRLFISESSDCSVPIHLHCIAWGVCESCSLPNSGNRTAHVLAWLCHGQHCYPYLFTAIEQPESWMCIGRLGSLIVLRLLYTNCVCVFVWGGGGGGRR